MVKTAVTNDSVFATRNDGKLRRHTGEIPAHHFLDKINGLFRSVKAPNEKRMKLGFANNCAISSTSSSRKERRMSRSVCNCMVGTPRCWRLGDSCSEDDVDRRRPRCLTKHRCLRVEDSAFHRCGIATYDTRATFDSDWRCANRTRNTRDQRSRRIHQVWPRCAKQQRIALRVICTNERPKLFLGKDQSAQR